MKNRIITLLGLVGQLLGACQEDIPAPQWVSQFSLSSAATGATYEIRVARPAEQLSANEKFATLYVLDGDDNFDLVSSRCKDLSAQYGTPNVLVVSIGYGRDRALDYTPTQTGENTGGAPQFLQFIREELVPRMEQEFNADTARSQRIILGHSYGGLFGAYAFVADNNLFGDYLLLSPSLWFDDEVTLRMEVTQRPQIKDRQQLVYLGQGERENLGKMQAPFESFYRTLNQYYPNTIVMKNLEPDLAHMGSRDPNIQKALDFYFLNR